ncbi:DeoR/GlpR family DNA-binding transcription regulator [Bacillota bacterium Meth-B3]|nr:DeoR/GlpR family DNA-binding transcription regulator [Christensenellaceae bacterium]MEA5066054.1 DeoR/GlpR family DNA-binding transcription regulator [Eubacteriales bacterium]MEA5067612.1 DeoR/GlpR family DNA-binding transcription regulator [Christensenellaceae bacterium]
MYIVRIPFVCRDFSPYHSTKEMMFLSNAYRLDQIYTILLRKGSATIEELSQSFHVTPTTIRRDLLVLEERNLIYRSRGSAHVKDSEETVAGIFDEEQKRIAATAAKFVASGTTLSLDSGRTVNAIISHLLNDDRITDLDIVTHSMSSALYAAQKYNVSIPGGALFKKMDTILGLEVEEFYRKINVDIAFLGSTGVHNCAGLTLSYPIQLTVKKASAECADKRIAVLDSSKFIRRGIYVFCDWHDIDTLVTTKTDENEAQLDRIAKQGVSIVLA